ncbi:MAG: hypothetical protein ACKO2K_12290 [Alphaproteobacteria bacterium]
MRSTTAAPEAGRRAGAVASALAVVHASLAGAHAWPAARLDPDLLSYLVYWRQLAAGSPVAFGYTVPKVLPVLLFGPLCDPTAAMLAQVAFAAAGAALLWTIADRLFGRATAVLAVLLYVLDPMRNVLTLRSSADLQTGVFLLAAILALLDGWAVAAAVAILLAALCKPTAAACGIAILALPGLPLARRVAAALLPLLALPAAAMLASALAGGGLTGALALPDQHERFVRVAQGAPLGLGDTLHLVLVEWFGGTIFARTWPLLLVGLGLFAARETGLDPAARRREAGFVLVPALLAAAYLGLAAVRPMVFFTRFLWLPTVVLATLGAWAAVRIAAALPGSALLRGVVLAALAVVMLLDRAGDHRWRAGLMLDPFERHARVAGAALDELARDGDCAGPAIVPLAYLPLAAWRLPDRLARGEVCAAEDWAEGRGCAAPSCLLFIPEAITRDAARDAVAARVRGGSIVGEGSENGALVHVAPGAPPAPAP